MDEEWDAQKMLDLYIYDYMMRKNMQTTAETFAKEANFVPKQLSLTPPGGFLPEWWSVFWDIYCARMKNDESSSQAGAVVDDGEAQYPLLDRPSMDVNGFLQKTSPAMSLPEFFTFDMISPFAMPQVEIMPNNASSSMFLGPQRSYNGSSMFPGLGNNYDASSSMFPGLGNNYDASSSIFPGLGHNYNAASSIFPGLGCNYNSSSAMFTGAGDNYNASSLMFPGMGLSYNASSSSMLPGAGRDVNMIEREEQAIQNMIAARMLEQERNRRPVRSLNSTSHFPSVEQLARLLASSGSCSSRRQETVAPTIQISVAQESATVTGVSKSATEEPAPETTKAIQGSNSGNSGASS